MFKKYMKMSLFEFILQYRIEKSVEYLGNTSYTITEIAQRVGFHDSNYFTKVFRAQKGCTRRNSEEYAGLLNTIHKKGAIASIPTLCNRALFFLFTSS